MRQGLKTVAFRADASLTVGTGHVMRCLSLADALAARGVRCLFLTRSRPGDLIELIRQRGHEVAPLCRIEVPKASETRQALDWLGVAWDSDAEECRSILPGPVDWLVVDHYGIDARWERCMADLSRHVFAIDDVSDRPHAADLLLDQNLFANVPSRYAGLVSPACIRLLGPAYALLRPEFAALRDTSLARRAEGRLERLLVFMSGGDVGNETCKAVEGVRLSSRANCMLDVVVGASFPFFTELESLVQKMPQACVHVQTPRMAELMVQADLAIMAGGSATWEKCVLGLPSVVDVLAENQKEAASLLHARGAQITLGSAYDLTAEDFAHSLDAIGPEQLCNMSNGFGIRRVIESLETLS